MPTTVDHDPAIPVAGLSQTERVIDAFIAPTKTFKDILRNTSWWLPFVLLALFTFAQSFVVERKVGFERVAENQVRLNPHAEEQISQLAPEQRAARMSMSAKITRIITFCSPLVLLIVFAIYSLIVWAAFNFGLGAQTTFAQVYAVTWYSALPFLVLSVLVILSLLAGSDVDGFNLQNPVGTNPAYYLTDAAPWIKALLQNLDVVRIWSVVLTIIGMATVAKKSITQSAVIIVGIYFVMALLTTAAAAMTS